MNNRERVNAILRYEDYDRMPLVRFGFWRETLHKWLAEGHVTKEQADGWACGNVYDAQLDKKLGFDFNWDYTFYPVGSVDLRWRVLYPPFEKKVVKELPDGIRHVLNEEGAIVVESPDAGGIAAEVGYSLTDRKSWEELYKPRLRFSQEAIDKALVRMNSGEMLPFGSGGREFLQGGDRDFPYVLYGGSMMGELRNWLGLEELTYMAVDDPALLEEMVETVAEQGYQNIKAILDTGAQFDLVYFWEDICYNHGPLVSPPLFNELAGPQYRRLTNLARQYGIDLAFVDCDGLIDSLIPTWMNNGINVMFPIEVGTWGASIKEMREQYGKTLRGVGGMRKIVFAQDKAAVDAEIERLKPLVELGGYIPCPDHHIAPDAEWDNVRYYCDRMHEVFG
ncbi:MAG: hypothetical protein DRP83_01250 [Planctomycetota bacterium]|nr:MAG: hypothetical protein DRP83_01250 [Planctomycetota bacterium]